MEDKYYINSKQLYSVLVNKGITNLYHANTVETSLTFIKKRALLSRGYIESHNLTQTEQKSDFKDKIVGVWNDVFLDGKDLGEYFRRPNYYGPVLFVMKLDLLNSPQFNNVLVTKNNPMYWDEKIIENINANRYYSSIKDIENNYLNGSYNTHARIMFTFRDIEEKMKLNKFCEKIILDQTNDKKINIDIESKIREALNENSLGHITLEKRENYAKAYSLMFNNKFIKMFTTRR